MCEFFKCTPSELDKQSSRRVRTIAKVIDTLDKIDRENRKKKERMAKRKR